MPLFDKETKTTVFVPFAVKTAEQIYGYFKEGLDFTQMFVQHNVPFADSQAVWDEAKALEVDIIGKATGEIECKVIPTTATQKEFEGEIKSVILPVATVLTDVIKTNPTKDDKRTWATFEKKEKVIIIEEPEVIGK
jgi:hypothetical protein